MVSYMFGMKGGGPDPLDPPPKSASGQLFAVLLEELFIKIMHFGKISQLVLILILASKMYPELRKIGMNSFLLDEFLPCF